MDEYKRRRRRSRAVMSMFLDSIGGSIDNVDVATFDSDGTDLKALVVGIEPIQDLHGYDNPWPAGGGKNKWEFGNVSITGTYTSLQLTNPLPAGTYTISTIWTTESSYAPQFRFCKLDASAIISVTLSSIEDNRRYATFTLTEAAYYIYAYSATGQSGYTATITDTQIESGSNMTTFAPYSNLCPISGHTDADVTRTGKNLFYGNGIASAGNNWRVKYGTGFPLKKGITYTATVFSETAPTISYFKGIDDTTLAQSVGKTVTYTPSADVYAWIDLYWQGGTGKPSTAPNFQLEVGSPATAYEEYRGTTYPIPLGQTVYGGTLDVLTGVLTVDRGITTDFSSLSAIPEASSDGTYMWSIRASNVFSGVSQKSISSFAQYRRDFNYGGIRFFGYTNDFIYIFLPNNDRSEVLAVLDGQQIVYELATPQTIQLTGQQIATFLGTNNVWCSSGQIIHLEY